MSVREHHDPAIPEGRIGRSLAFLTFLELSGTLDTPGRRRAESALLSGRERLETILLELGLVEEHRLYAALAQFVLGSVATQLEADEETVTALKLEAAYLLQNGIVPLASTGAELRIASCFPLDDDAARLLAYIRGRTLKLDVATLPDITRSVALLQSAELQSGTGLYEGGGEAAVLESDAERLRDLASEAPTVRLLNRIITAAVERDVSDIHIEPLHDHIRVRYRVDGVLQVVDRIDKPQQMGLISRVKILSRLNIAEQRLPQDGRIRFAVKGREIDFRVSTAPAVDGESVVLRILDRRDISLDFEALGFTQQAIGQLTRMISQPNGIVLVTGPTGSGKTTTLYAALSRLNSADSKIFTVEDPVEYQLRGITQILVRPQIGLDFASVLRSVLRQDPDIIMVGEIRDPETARIAVQASLTGHLVLSTLHTNSAVSSLTRLKDIGIEDYLITSTLRGVVSQRLVRKLCSVCHGASAAAAGKREGIEAVCKSCGNSGYRGRTVIYEILEISDAVRSAVLRGAPESEIEQIAANEGMVSLQRCADRKIETGETSAAEVARTVGAAVA